MKYPLKQSLNQSFNYSSQHIVKNLREFRFFWHNNYIYIFNFMCQKFFYINSKLQPRSTRKWFIWTRRSLIDFINTFIWKQFNGSHFFVKRFRLYETSFILLLLDDLLIDLNDFHVVDAFTAKMVNYNPPWTLHDVSATSESSLLW